MIWSITRLALESLVILALALGISWAWRDRSAASRHLLLSAACWGLVLLPMLSAVVPVWHVPLLPPAESVSSGSSLDPVAPVETRSPDQAAQSPAGVLRPEHLLVTIWGLGVAIVLLRFLIIQLRARSFAARSVPVRDSVWNRRLDTVDWPTPLPELRVSDDLHSPMVVGFVRPMIIVPRSTLNWPEETVDATVLHELAHVHRRDLLHQLVAQLVCALYWYNPLTWWAAHRLGVEREMAADDFVLSQGFKSSDYAAHLLNASHDLRPYSRFSLESIAMARGTDFKVRMVAVLDPNAERTTPAPRARWLAVAAWTVLALGLASISPRAAPAPAAESVEPGPVYVRLDDATAMVERTWSAFDRRFEAFETEYDTWELAVDDWLDREKSLVEQNFFDDAAEVFEEVYDGFVERMETELEALEDSHAASSGVRPLAELGTELEDWYDRASAGLDRVVSKWELMKQEFR